MRNKITAAIMLAAVLLLGGCSLTGNVLPPAHTDALPVVTVTLPGNDTAARPERTPAPGVDNAINSGTDYSSLDGVAEPGDVLPILTYDEARQQNRDVIGWISIPGTSIDYPVVRTDDNEFYLNHNVLKEESKHGAIFMDFRNADRGQQKHIILYGHDMKNGTMFHGLLNFKQKSFFSENRIISFNWDGTDTM